MSQREIGALSLDALLEDVEVVFERTGLERVPVFGVQASGIIAMSFALRHPERVSHLILIDAYPDGSAFLDTPQTRVFRAMIDEDWQMFSEALAHAMFGWAEPELGRLYAEFVRDCVTREVATAFFDVIRETDLTPQLGQIACPVLVVKHRRQQFPSMETAQGLTAMLPDASLLVLDHDWHSPGDDLEKLDRALDDLMGARPAPAVRAAAAPSGMATILFTDITDSTALTQRLGDAKAQELVRAHNTIVREALAAHGGTEIKHTGDGIMASFPTASGAVECGITIQRAVARRLTQGGEVDLDVHMGLNAGEPVVEDADLYGTAVQLARRICDQASAGEILVSDVVRQLAAGKGFLFADRGEVLPKGFDEAVRLYEVRWAEGAP
jgi:class 3 adenylate cyclase